jgi:hypothetical protein
MRLGGWARIWIVLCVLYGALVILIAYDSRPTLREIQRDWLYDGSARIAEGISGAEGQYVSASDVQERISKGNTEKGIAWLQRVQAHPRPDQKSIPQAIAPINAKYVQRINQLPQDQVRFWGGAFLWWAGGCLLLFGLGWSIGWIARGFRKSAA